MKVLERNVMRLVAVQHLRTAYGIKTKNWNKNKASRASASISKKVFGVPLENLPCYNMDNGIVPRFLVDACINLTAHVDTEGLFRKSGSVVRLKALRAKLDAGEDCLSTALPCDVAGLVKQFFRELPEPVFASELQDAFLKAQQLNSEEERTAATMLLSCVLPERNQNTLRHFFEFLQTVSSRSVENKMDSSNLSVILAPNLLHSADGAEKMNTNTEKRLKLQAAVVHCFIENAHSFGVLPQFLQERVPAMMGCDSDVLSPTHEELRELDLNSGMKRRPRRSFGVFSSATPVIATPNSKRKLPLESGHSFGFSNKKRRSMKKNLGIDLLPDPMFNGTSTPGSARSASGVLDSSNTCASGGRSQRRSVTSARRKSRRLSSRHLVSRVESGKAGCFSPKVNKKDAPRKSLRMRFSLGKSSKDAGSESIGWRLASQESTTSFCFTKEMEFISPSVLPRISEANSTKFISKSEDNLLTPHPHSSDRQAVWTETPVTSQDFNRGSFPDTPMSMCLKNTFSSEPAIVIAKPSPMSSRPLKLCCTTSAGSLESEGEAAEAQIPTGSTLLKINQAFTEWSSDCQPVACNSPAKTSISNDVSASHPETPVNSVASSSVIPARQSFLANYDNNVTFGQMELACLSPLHIDSVVFDCDTNGSLLLKASKGTALNITHDVLDSGEKEEELVDCSRLIDALDIQSPAHFKLGVSSGLQSTPYRPDFEPSAELCTPPRADIEVSVVDEKPDKCTKADDQKVAVSPDHLQSQKRRVAERIQHFNRLTLRYPEGSQEKASRSPLRFQRTPVRQTVRRINSLMGENRRPTRGFVQQSMQVPKAVSLETGLSPYPQSQHNLDEPQVHSVKSVKKPPPVPPKKPSTLARKAKQCALEDVTNKVQPKIKLNTSECHQDQPGPQNPFVQQVVEKEMHHYRGSPRNPLTQTRLLSATKPVDF
ncbi:rho GTPase-activating protein 11A isoform X2 [Boleophthalmus pectinirostris]|uniref:rho GTPase-activating protein 11A isoform X2 n=1 Tax=Boleophthalmus pectinirostris TaxID=150288 RepID=UPI0024309C13|nr:rho GTPase-activating protein 11A isoform X2 [Boleophthalmus pectinirostris]